MDQLADIQTPNKSDYEKHILARLAECGLSRAQALPVCDYISERLDFLGHEFSEASSIFAFKDKISRSAQLLHVAYEDFLDAALAQPPLFTLAPETVDTNVTASAQKLGVSREAFIKASLKQASLFYKSPDTLDENTGKAAELLGLAKSVFVKAAIRQPSVLCLTAERVNGNIESAALVLGVTKEDYIKAALRQPSLFSRSSAKLSEKMDRTAELLGIGRQDFIKAAMSQPSLFTYRPSKINDNVETAARLLGVSKENYVATALKLPTLFYRSPEKINRNVEAAARELGLSKEDVLTKVIARQPSLMTQKPETISEHARLIRRFEQKGLIPVSADELMQRSPGLLTLSDDNFLLRRAYAAVVDLHDAQDIKLLKTSRQSIERAFVTALGHDPDVTVITATRPPREIVDTQEEWNLRILIANIKNGLLSGYTHAPELADQEEDISWEEKERIMFGEPELEI